MIRPATERDLPRIAEIHALAWQEAYKGLLDPAILAPITKEARLETWTEWFKHTDQTVHVLEGANEIQGFTRVSPPHEIAEDFPQYGELTHIYQQPDGIGTGIGHRLFEHAKQLIAKGGSTGMLLWVLEENVRARRFYENQGMYPDGARKDEPDWLGEGVFEVRYVLQFD